MSRDRTSSPRSSRSDRSDLYADITNSVIAQLEAGRVRWVQPWAGAGASLDMPHNPATRHHYSGINILILWDAEADRLMADAEWLPEPLRTPVPVLELTANDAETADLPAFLDEQSGGAPGTEGEADPLQAIAAE